MLSIKQKQRRGYRAADLRLLIVFAYAKSGFLLRRLIYQKYQKDLKFLKHSHEGISTHCHAVLKTAVPKSNLY